MILNPAITSLSNNMGTIPHSATYHGLGCGWCPFFNVHKILMEKKEMGKRIYYENLSSEGKEIFRDVFIELLEDEMGREIACARCLRYIQLLMLAHDNYFDSEKHKWEGYSWRKWLTETIRTVCWGSRAALHYKFCGEFKNYFDDLKNLVDRLNHDPATQERVRQFITQRMINRMIDERVEKIFRCEREDGNPQD